MSNLVADVLSRISNWSPVFHVSIDSQFGSIDDGLPNRFSLIEFSLGRKKYYILSLVKNDSEFKFKLFEYINFYDICIIKTEKDIQDKVCSYENYIADKNDEEVKNNIEFLMYKIGLNQSRIVSGNNKTNSYTAIILVYIGFIAYILSKIVGFDGEYSLSQYTMYVLIAMSVYYALNCSLFIKTALSIKGYTRSSFRDLKKNPSLKKLACAYYTDWYSTNNESQVITSIVANIEKYFTRSFVMSLSVWLILFWGEHMTPSPSVTEINSYNSEYIVFDRSGEFQESEFIKLLSSINLSSNSIYIVSNKDDKRGAVVSSFVKLAVSKPDRIIEIDFKSDIVDSQAVLIKYKE